MEKSNFFVNENGQLCLADKELLIVCGVDLFLGPCGSELLLVVE